MALTQVQGGMILPSTTLTTPIVATTMGVGGATPASSGSGITFPATQSASTDANTLDDYEEGTWTPGVGGRTFATVSGKYTKIGNMVYVYFEATTMSGGSITNGSLTGLPFVSSNSGQWNSYLPIPEMSALTLISGYKTLYCRVGTASTDGIILQSNGEDHTSGVIMNNGSNIRGAGFYFAA